MLVTNKDLIVPARKNGYAICTFNVQNLESMSAVAEAAAEEKSPVIMQITPSVIKYAGLAYISSLVRTAPTDRGLTEHDAVRKTRTSSSATLFFTRIPLIL